MRIEHEKNAVYGRKYIILHIVYLMAKGLTKRVNGVILKKSYLYGNIRRVYNENIRKSIEVQSLTYA